MTADCDVWLVGTQLPGFDLSHQSGLAAHEDCWSSCIATDGCNAATYHAVDGRCYFKSLPDDAVPVYNGAVDLRRRCDPGQEYGMN